jgi:class 3 adenylate cyclase
MPLYMDVHRNLGRVTADDVAQAHLKDTEIEKDYGVHYHKYWFNEASGAIFCLVEGPDAATCELVHREAHGLVADDLIEVQPTLVEAFLSTSVNNVGAAVTNEGSYDTGFRVIVFTEVDNFTEVLANADHEGIQLIEAHDIIVRRALAQHNGREVMHTGQGIQACFSSVTNALRFAHDVQARCAEDCAPIHGGTPRLRVGIAAGEPVESNRTLFGVSVTTARRICEIAPAGGVLVSAAIRELAVGKAFKFAERESVQLKGLNEPVTLYELQKQMTVATVAPPQITAAPSARVRRSEVVREFWRELKRRHVVTVGAVYAAALFMMLQVAQLTFEPLGLPPWTYTLLLIIGIFGLPLALVLAWAFDLNAEPERGSSLEHEKSR